MRTYKLTIFTRYSVSVDIEADSIEDAEEKLWDLYNAGTIDPLDNTDTDVETNIECDGIV